MLNGGTGTDTVTYANSTAAVNVNLTTGAVSGGDAQGDTLTSIEKIIGSSFNDTLASATTGTTLQGGTGDDIYIIGNAGVTLAETANGGSDEVRTALASLSIAAGDTFESLAGY